MVQLKISTKKIITVSFLVDLFDILSNLVVAILTGSAVIFAEMVQGIADSIGSFLLVLGYKKSGKPSDSHHPLGHTREVFFWALVSSLIMFFFGSGLTIWRGYQQLIDPAPITNKILALGILIVSVSTNGYAFSLSYRKMKKPGTNLIKTLMDSKRQLVKTALLRDALGTLSAIIGLISIALFEIFNIVAFDAIGAILIGIVMGFFAIILIRQNRHLIIGAGASDDTISQIRNAVLDIPEVVGVNKIIAVHVGANQIYVDIDIDLNENLTTIEIEKVLDKIEVAITNKMPIVSNIRFNLNSPK